MTSDPVGHGLVASLSRPGANMTGVSLDAGIEILSKRLELLKEIAPRMMLVGYLAPRGAVADRVGMGDAAPSGMKLSGQAASATG